MITYMMFSETIGVIYIIASDPVKANEVLRVLNIHYYTKNLQFKTN